MVGFAVGAAVLAIGALVLLIFSFGAAMPRVLTTTGEPGEQIIAVTDAPGTITAELSAGEKYSLWVVGSAPSSQLSERVTITDPSGEDLPLHTFANATLTVNGVHARLLDEFNVKSDGPHVISVPAPATSTPGSVEVYLAPALSTLASAGGFLGVLGGIFGVIIFGLIAVALGVGGGIWWRSRIKKRRAQQQTAPSPYARPPYY